MLTHNCPEAVGTSKYKNDFPASAHPTYAATELKPLPFLPLETIPASVPRASQKAFCVSD